MFKKPRQSSSKLNFMQGQIGGPEEIAKMVLKPESVVFKNPETFKDRLIETFFNQFMASSLEKKVSEDRNQARYKGLGYISFISYVFFNSSLKPVIKLVDSANKTIAFELDITRIAFSQASLITSDCIDGFVAGKEIEGKQLFPYCIYNQYPNESFPEGAPFPSSIDWATFRIEINELILRLSELSNQDIEKMLRLSLNGEDKNFDEQEKKEFADVCEIIGMQLDKLRIAAINSVTFSLYQCSRLKSDEGRRQRDRKNQFYPTMRDVEKPTMRQEDRCGSNGPPRRS